MASFEEDFYLENPSRWQAIKRDVRLLCTLFGYAILWITKGAQVRRAYNRAGKTGTPLILEELIDD
jgi:hypothetical protein